MTVINSKSINLDCENNVYVVYIYFIVARSQNLISQSRKAVFSDIRYFSEFMAPIFDRNMHSDPKINKMKHLKIPASNIFMSLHLKSGNLDSFEISWKYKWLLQYHAYKSNVRNSTVGFRQTSSNIEKCIWYVTRHLEIYVLKAVMYHLKLYYKIIIFKNSILTS